MIAVVMRRKVVLMVMLTRMGGALMMVVMLCPLNRPVCLVLSCPGLAFGQCPGHRFWLRYVRHHFGFYFRDGDFRLGSLGLLPL